MKPVFMPFDTESTDLNGSFGHLLCAAFCSTDSDSVNVLRLDSEEYRGESLHDDSKLVAAIKEILEKSFAWVSWNGKMHDVPLINARLAKAGMDPLIKRLHVDAMYYFRRPFLSLHSSKLEEVAKTFTFKWQKTKLNPNTWVAAYELNGAAMDEVCDHCKADTLALKEAFLLAVPHLTTLHR
jgi:uncharacterized protein YprB with RNaseH-like and TPR domain